VLTTVFKIMGLKIPIHQIGDKVTVHDRSYSKPTHATYYKKGEGGYYFDYEWEGVITHITYDIISICDYAQIQQNCKVMLLQDHPIVYYVKKGNYHSSKVWEVEQMWGGAFLYPNPDKKLNK
jgi:hypothetical protein